MAIYVNKEKAKKMLADAPDQRYFYIDKNRVLKNIYDLLDFFSVASQQEFERFVNREKNDFFNWLKDVFENERLAKAMYKARTPGEAKLYTQRNIKMLERNAKR